MGDCISAPSMPSFSEQTTAKEVVDAYGGPGCARGKTAVVTGGASGVGLETCKALAYAGCRVLVASRNPEGYKAKVEKAIREEGDYQVPDATLVHLRVDLEDLSSVRALGAELSSEPRIDFLVCNAGVMAIQKLEHTKDGFEKQIAINHFAHHYLYRLLEAKLVTSARAHKDVRVVCLSSGAHARGGLDVRDMHYRSRAYVPLMAYSQSKLANVLFAKSVADRAAASGAPIHAVSLHPGVIATDLWRHQAPDFVATRAYNKTPAQGAATSLFACLSPEVARPEMAGAYLVDSARGHATNEADDARGELRAALWAATEEQLRAAGYALPADGA